MMGTKKAAVLPPELKLRISNGLVGGGVRFETTPLPSLGLARQAGGLVLSNL